MFAREGFGNNRGAIKNWLEKSPWKPWMIGEFKNIASLFLALKFVLCVLQGARYLYDFVCYICLACNVNYFFFGH